MATRWVIADLHFGHFNVIGYAGRPFADVEQMNETLIKNWNNTVAKEDTVYVLGDFTLSRQLDKIKAWCNALNGNKVLIMGNHDTRRPVDYIACGFKVALRKPILVEPTVILSHEPPTYICPDMIYIHGHVHERMCDADTHINCTCVSVEQINYRPINLDKLIKQIEKEKMNYDARISQN